MDVDENGLYRYNYFDQYWTENERFPFLIKVNEKYGGFAFVRKLKHETGSSYYSMAEFFILKKYRKIGVGKQSAFQLFNFFPGEWEISEVEENIPSQWFWRRIISEYTNGRYIETEKKNGRGPVQRFYSMEDTM
ncbi:GNAT family N-acetyltransferase [Bacillus spongiae]|uniref:GNAT family N-acetyltransferase n=1 Tax=Bacillus spongiae TaxID=2683610 RepID=A0ABU8HJ37_9BACI